MHCAAASITRSLLLPLLYALCFAHRAHHCSLFVLKWFCKQELKRAEENVAAAAQQVLNVRNSLAQRKSESEQFANIALQVRTAVHIAIVYDCYYLMLHTRMHADTEQAYCSQRL
jgi:hypothetical protein